MEGRGVGTQGLRRAADYIEEQIRTLGLSPTGSGYRQPFRATTGVALGPGNRLEVARSRMQLGTDFTPFGFSSSGAFSGGVVFAGYGIRAEPLGYDDYAELDVAGKAVLAMRYEPRERDETSPFDGRRPSRFSDLRYKAHLAREAGASALLLVAPPGQDEDRLPVLRNDAPISRAGIPVLQIRRELAERMLAAEGEDLSALHAAIDAETRPHSRALPSVRVAGVVDVVATESDIDNVIGILPGRGPREGEVVVVAAHYDHLGFGGSGSREPSSQAIHNGADDNASGVAAMLCAVGSLRGRLDASDAPRRTLLVIAFGGEEIGLAGSAHYVREPARPLANTVAMINLDMVGRLRDDVLTVMGTDSAPEWTPLLEELARKSRLQLAAGGDGYGPSDQTYFYQKGIPVAHLFTGAHSEYHTPADDVATLNLTGGGRIAGFLVSLLEELLVAGTDLSYVAAAGGPPLSGDSRSYGAYLGTIPDFTKMAAQEGGVDLVDVRRGGPAHEAGLRGGDRIVSMAGTEIRNLYDMTFVLREHRPGEVIEIVVVRGDQRLRFGATLGRRGPNDEAPGPHPSHPIPSDAGTKTSDD